MCLILEMKLLNFLDNDYNRVYAQEQAGDNNIEQSIDFNDSEQVEPEYCGDQESEQDQQQNSNVNLKQLINQNSLARNANQFNGLDTNTSIESGP